MALGADLRAFKAKMEARKETLARYVVIGLITDITLSTPVGDPKFWKRAAPKGYIGGRLRANWQIGVGALPTGTIAAVDPSGRITIERETAKVPEQGAAGKVYYIANNLPYALPIEQGHSRQAAPGAMVEANLIRYQTVVDAAVAKAKAEHP